MASAKTNISNVNSSSYLKVPSHHWKALQAYIKIRITRQFPLIKFHPALLTIIDVFSYPFPFKKALVPS